MPLGQLVVIHGACMHPGGLPWREGESPSLEVFTSMGM